jgi:hypothetical protein
MRYCNKCNREKDKSEFGIDKQKKDGLCPYCKECIREKSKRQRQGNLEYAKKYADEYRQKNKELLRKKSRQTYWRDREKRLEQGKKSYYKYKEIIAKRRKIQRSTPEFRKKEAIRQKEWRSRNKIKYGKYIRDWQRRNREKINAHARVHTAVSNGTLKRSEVCEMCKVNIGKMEGHHEDYSKPLDVIWLCRKCHASKNETVGIISTC